MKHDYDTLVSDDIDTLTVTIRRYADAGWRVHTLIHYDYIAQEDATLKVLAHRWIALMERNAED